ncbi:hypothetical protein ZIOFF_061407 [Zingiber officinale]|uniref:Uncharacterized protein n=1 Tax=Zingiber officinale TaxID=94328 RepID=A0A8J5F004_ZINOF|nr:hypothetical protein ZIOFF_061407 [Zingiber officinale]
MHRQRAMSWRKVGKAAQELAAHALLFCYTFLLALKIDGGTSYSWWIIFVPLWLFHAVVARGRFSLPAPSLPHDRRWAPCHAIVAIPLLIAFELLLCIFLHNKSVNTENYINLKVVFLPLLAFEITILVDNFRSASSPNRRSPPPPPLPVPSTEARYSRARSGRRYFLSRRRVAIFALGAVFLLRSLCLLTLFLALLF